MVDFVQDPNFVGWLNRQIGLLALESGTTVNVSTYDIRPSNSPAKNDVNLAVLKATMLAAPATTWYLEFPAGAYTYSNNRWLWGVQRVVIDAYDATFQCTSADANFVNGIPLWNGDFFDETGDVTGPHLTYTNGYKFNTAAAGALSLTTTTAADAGNFTPGMRVVLAGYDQQGGGYPANLRYFEYKTVLTANAGTGVITFAAPLRYLYDSRWWDTAYPDGDHLSHGAPRILSLDRAKYKQAQLIWVKGANFLANLVTPASCTLQLTADLVLLEDVQGVSFNCGESDVTLMSRCNFPGNGASSGQSSGDKIANRLVLADTSMGASGYSGAFVDCVGCNSVSLIRATVYGNISQVAPRNLILSDCDIIPLTGTVQGISSASSNPMRAVGIEGTRVYNSGGLNNGFTNQASPGLALTVGTVVGTDIRLSFDATGKAVAYSIDYGMTLTCTATGNTGIITAIYYETGSPGTLRIAGTWSAPSPGDVFNYYDVIQISDLGGNRIIGTQVPFWRAPPGPLYQDGSINSLSIATALINSLKPNNQIQAKSYGLQVVDENGNNIGYFGSHAFNLQSGSAFNCAPGAGLAYSEGANCLQGEAVLVGGTVTVNTTAAGAASRIFLSRKTAGGTLGNLTFTINNGVSFTINSTSGTDTSTVDWIIFNHQ